MRIAIIGTGMIVERAHLPTLAASPKVELAAICGRNQDRAAGLAQRFNIQSTTNDWKELVSRSDIDALLVANHNVVHAQICGLGLQAGKHVFCEKPMATETDSLAALGAIAAASQATLAVNFNMRLMPEMVAIKQAFDQGRFGVLRTLRVQLRRREGVPGLGSWFTRRSMAGGGALLDLGSHMADLGLWFTGFAPALDLHGDVWADHGRRGFGAGDWRPPEADQFCDVDDRAAFSWRTPGGARVDVDVAWAYHGPDGLSVEVVGTTGGCLLMPTAEAKGMVLRWFTEGPEGFSEHISDPPTPAMSRQAWTKGFAEFLKACDGGKANIATFDQAAASLRLLLAMRQQALAMS